MVENIVDAGTEPSFSSSSAVFDDAYDTDEADALTLPNLPQALSSRISSDSSVGGHLPWSPYEFDNGFEFDYDICPPK
ncbi:hypothetical protein OQA88_2035 [Cercophora sp. LCS_1]